MDGKKRYLASALLAAVFVVAAQITAQFAQHFIDPLLGWGWYDGYWENLADSAVFGALISPLWLWAQHRLDRAVPRSSVN